MPGWIKGVFMVSASLTVFLVFGVLWNQVAAKDEDYKNLVVFNEVMRKVQDSYVEKPDLRKLTLGALRGLAFGVDVFSCYLSPEEKKFVDSRKEHAAFSSGIILAPRSGFYRVMAVRPGSSAEKAGILPGDLLEEIEGRGTSEMPLPYVQAMLIGPAGSEVKVGIQRGQDDDLRELTLKRESFTPSTPEFRILEPGYGYLKVREIHDKATDEVRRALNTLASSGVKSLVLDLRDCCTGSVEDGLEVANLFVASGTLAVRITHGGERTTLPAAPEKAVFSGPMVILVNGFTSGAAELVAAALKDNGRGKLVGLKTLGTASEQKWQDLPDGSALYLTSARYLSPAGQAFTHEKYNQAGIRPDLKSPPEDFALSLYIDYEMSTGDESVSLYRKYVESVYEKQLEQAVDLLKNPEKDLRAGVVEN